MAVTLKTSFAGIPLSTPLIAASGTIGYGDEAEELVDITQFGALTTKTITREPRPGNDQPRLLETPSGLLNSIGLQNVGLDAFVRDVLPWWETRTLPRLIVSVGGNDADEYVEICQQLDGKKRIDAFEINISCPNVKHGCLAIGTDPAQVANLVARLKQSTRTPLIIKLSPNSRDIVAIARSAADAGADCLSLVNTFVGMAVDVDRQQMHFKNKVAGLSGPAIRPLALKLVYDVVHAVDIPVIGMGGIMTARDALEFLLVGARAVSIGTTNLVHPDAVSEIVQEIVQYCEQRGVASIDALIGAVC